MLHDKQQEEPVCRCSVCGGEIYRGETYYTIHLTGQVVCDDCLWEDEAE